MSNWDRRILLDLADVVKKKILDERTTNLQKQQLAALLEQFHKSAETVLATSQDVRDMKHRLCGICKEENLSCYDRLDCYLSESGFH